MKKMKFLSAAIVATLLVVSCSKDDDDNNTKAPEEVNEEEVITTLIATLTPVPPAPQGAVLAPIELKYYDEDGDGPKDPVITGGTLSANTVYNGVIKLLNETESPAEDITEEVKEEADEHQFFYTVGTGLNVTAVATDKDSKDLPLGVEFKLTTTTASTGKLTFTLRHEPKKPNTGLEDAGGATDIATTFDIVVEDK